ncbi:hypothetical protein [Bradyrhizobium tunisiense]|uniref:hypothetical protein n=1 Tax=Bradyrhizobium tunisiense TaxID=3278709 RepID=UPI0035DD87C4
MTRPRQEATPGAVLKLRPIGRRDYAVLEDGQAIGRIRYASERTPGIWIWNCTVHIPCPPAGSSQTLDAAKADFKAAWSKFKARHGEAALAKAYKAMNLRKQP